MRQPGKQERQLRHASILKLNAEGLENKLIAERLGVGLHTVQRVLKKAGRRGIAFRQGEP